MFLVQMMSKEAAQNSESAAKQAFTVKDIEKTLGKFDKNDSLKLDEWRGVEHPKSTIFPKAKTSNISP